MAAVSAAPTVAATATALTPPGSAHGNTYEWESSPQQVEGRQNTGISQTFRGRNLDAEWSYDSSAAFAYPSPQPEYEIAKQQPPRDVNGGLAESIVETQTHGPSRGTVAPEAFGSDTEDTSSKWIHRDKLARIESEELQAAGIILPKTRARSKPRRDLSVDRTNGSYRRGGTHESDTASLSEQRARKHNASAQDRAVNDSLASGWDLRLPEEIAEESYFVPPSGTRGVSRIPVAKASPAPIPLEHMERDTLMARRRDDCPGAEENIAYPKARSRSSSAKAGDSSASPQRNPNGSSSDSSPKKAGSGAPNGAPASSAAGQRKTSGPAKSTSSGGRPKTRSGASKESGSSGTGPTRPSTRSGERELSRELTLGASSKQPEGEPPWMISAYRPDPRLPPDQQLLPTVARRLQQEKWEREGKFGNIYDKEFRPLTDDGFLSPPGASEKRPTTPSASSATAAAPDSAAPQNEWPLKPEAKSPTLQSGRVGSYSTMPRIQDRPSTSPMPSPRVGTAPQTSNGGAGRMSAAVDEDDGSRKGCGCCVVM